MSSTPFVLSGGDFLQTWSDGAAISVGTLNTLPAIPGIELYSLAYLAFGATGAPGTGSNPASIVGESASPSGATFAANGGAGTTYFANNTNAQAVTSTSGGIFEFDQGFNTIAFQGSGTAASPNIVLYMDSTSRTGVTLTFKAIDIDTAAVTGAGQAVAVQYRLGSGAWTTIGSASDTGTVTATSAGGAVATTGGNIIVSDTGSTATPGTTTITAVLPAAADNRADLQLRIVTQNQVGNDQMIGIDDIGVTSSPGAATSIGITSSVSLSEGAAGATTPFAFTVTRSGDTSGTSTVAYATADGTATAGSDYAAQSGTLTFAPGETTKTITVLVNGDGDVEGNETFTVTLSGVTGAALSNAVGTGTIVNDDVGITRIYALQGSGHTSPFVGQTVTTTGVVTAIDTNGRGYWLQDAAGDGNINTSDAIHVFYANTGQLPSGLAVGATVQVTGSISEFQPSTRALTQTELDVSSAANATVTGTAALPAPVVIGVLNDPANGFRKAPTVQVGDNPTTGVFDPATQGSDFWETLEGMRITIKDARATSPSGTVFVTPDDPSNPSNTPRGGLVIADTTPGASPSNLASHVFDFNPEAVQLFGSVNSVSVPGGINVGDRLGDVTGIALVFNAPEILPTQALTVTAGGLTRETTTIASSLDRISVGGFNVENLAPIGFAGGGAANTLAKYDGLAQAIITNMGTPTIVALEEIQDNNGTTNDSVVAADVTLAQLIAAIVRNGGPQYTAIDVPPVDDQDGGAPGGNIRSAYLYLADRVSPTAANNLTTAQRMETVGATTVTATIQTFPTAQRVGTGDANFASTRKPAPIEWSPTGFTDTAGGTFWTLNVHLTSKGGSEALYGTNLGPDSGPLYAENLNAGAIKREGQGIVVNAWADGVLANAKATDDRIVVLGDFNEFQFFPTVKLATGALTRATVGSGNAPSTFTAGAAVLTTMIETLPANERYSYNFNGNAQALDQVLVTNGLVPTTLYDIVHINSEFASQLSDHDPSVTSLLMPRSAAIATSGNDVIDQAAYTAKFGSTAAASLSGNDIIFALEGNDTVSAGTGADVVYGNQGDDVLYGNQGDDVMYGGQNNDVLYGGQNNDTLFGNLGDDALYGNLGDDVLEGGLGVNRLDGGDGSDTAAYTASVEGVTVNLLVTTGQVTDAGTDTLVSVENLLGSSFADLLTGDAGANVLSGAGGADVLNGGFGTDTLYGGAGGDQLYGNQDADVLFGGEGADQLYGGQGADQLWGGTGNDILVGGLADDTFVFETGFGMDLITDWAVGGGFDRIRFTPGTFASYAQVSASMTQVDMDVVITLNSGDVVRVLNTMTSALTADHFIFG